MDSIAKTTGHAFVGYFNTLRKIGGASLSERKKLLLLWFFNYLRNDSDFVHYYENSEDVVNEWKVDNELVAEIEQVFMQNISCLTDNTCNIRLLEGDCTPVVEAIGFINSQPEERKYLLALNDTTPIGIIDSLDSISLQQAMENFIWEEGSGLIIDNDHTDENVYFEYNVKPVI